MILYLIPNIMKPILTIKGIKLGRSDAALMIFSLALIMRLLNFALSTDNPLLYQPFLDEAYYIELGRAIAMGFWKGEERLFFMDPLYGYILGMTFWLFGENITTMRLLQILLDSLNAVLIYALGARLWSRSVGILAGIIYAGYKVAFFYTLLILKTTLSISLSLLFIMALFHVVRARRSLPWFLIGLFAAMMVYLRANFLLYLPLAMVSYWWLERPKFRLFLKHSALLLLGFGLLLLIGGLRNYLVSGEMVLLNTQSGRLLYACNNPENLTGRYNVPSFSRPHPEDSERDFHKEAENRLGRKLRGEEVSSYWRGEALKFLIKNPRITLFIVKNKLKGTLADYEIPTNHSYNLAAQFSILYRFPLPTFAFALAFGAAGIVIGVFYRRETVFLLIPIFSMLITVSIFYTSSRFRMPAVPFLLIGAGISIVALVRWFRDREIKKILALSVLIILIYIFSLSASKPKYGGHEEFFLAKAYWSQKAFEKAKEVASEATKRFPDQARFPNLLGMIALSENRFEEAVQHHLNALRLDPTYADAYHNLGLTYLINKRPDEAVKAIMKAIAVEPRERYLFSLAKAYEALGEKDEAIKLYKEYLSRTKPGNVFRDQAMKRLKELY